MPGFTGLMAKSIKKSYKFLFVIAGIIIVLPTIMFSFMRIPAVQTLMIRRMTSHFSEKISSTLSIEKLDYHFFNMLDIKGLIIRDRHDDTLVYAPKITIGIRNLSLRNKSMTFGRITVDRPVVAFITDSTGEMNLSWYLDLMRNPKDSLKKGYTGIRINHIEVTNGRFSLVNLKGKKSIIPTDFSNLRLSDINGHLEDFVIKNDTTSFEISILLLPKRKDSA